MDKSRTQKLNYKLNHSRVNFEIDLSVPSIPGKTNKSKFLPSVHLPLVFRGILIKIFFLIGRFHLRNFGCTVLWFDLSFLHKQNTCQALVTGQRMYRMLFNRNRTTWLSEVSLTARTNGKELHSTHWTEVLLPVSPLLNTYPHKNQINSWILSYEGFNN